MYIPSALYTPLLTERNDVNITLLAGDRSGNTVIDMQAAYMPLKHLGTTASYTKSIGQGSTFSRWEMGAGYVRTLSKTSCIELYAGAGSGKIMNMHQTGASNISHTHYYVQPAFSFHNESRKLQLAFVSRFTGVNFRVGDTTFSNYAEPYNTKQVNSLQAKPFRVIWEPGITLRTGWKYFQFHICYATAADLSDSKLNIAKSNFSLGTSIRFNVAKKLVKSK